jgi:hypothetical protein
VVQFAVVPAVVAAMFVFLPADQAVRIGCCWCCSPVRGLGHRLQRPADGSSQRLLAATPPLPGFLYVFPGADLADIVEIGPFFEASSC